MALKWGQPDLFQITKIFPFTHFPKCTKSEKERGTLIQIMQTRLSFFFLHQTVNSKFPRHLSCLSLGFSLLPQSCQYLSSYSPSSFPHFLPFQHSGNTKWKETSFKIPEEQHHFLHLKHKSLVQNYSGGHGSQKDRSYTLFTTKTRKDLNVWGFQEQDKNYL